MADSIGIYALRNINNGKMYIGQSRHLEKRKKMHFWMLKNNRHFNVHLQRAWNLGDRFDFIVLEKCKSDECNEKEIYWIAKFRAMETGYNLCKGGEATEGYHFTEESKRKISEKNKGRKCNKEVVEQRKATLKKRLETDPEFARKHKERLAEIARSNFAESNKHKVISERQKKIVSEKLKGRYISEEHKDHLRELYSGEKSLTAKLKREDVIDIRYRFLSGERQRDILKDYPNITPQTIYDIVRNRRWHSVPNTIKELEEMRWKTETSEQDKRVH